MIALVSFLLVILLSVIIVKIGGIALEMTGLSRDIASFQAQSAFTGVGFTTKESESIMDDPVRRQVLRFLMLLGSAGITSAIAALVITFTKETKTRTIFGYTFLDGTLFDASVLLVGVVFLFIVSKTRAFDSFLRWVLTAPLKSFTKNLFLYDYEHLLALSEGHSIGTFQVPKNHWMAEKTIGQLRIKKEGVLVLGITRVIDRKEKYIGTPSLEFKILSGDKITVYGRVIQIADLAKRPKGEKGKQEHQFALQKAEILKGVKKLREKQFEELHKLQRSHVTKIKLKEGETAIHGRLEPKKGKPVNHKVPSTK